MGKRNLFEDDGSGDDTAVNEIKINDEFARRFEHNKKREELQRYEELKKKGAISDSDSDDSSTSESEDEGFSKVNDVEFFDVLLKVKNGDPCLKDKDTKLFKSVSDDKNSGSDGGKRKEKKKKQYLKDVIAKQLIENGPELKESDDDDSHDVDIMLKTHDEEQKELVRAFLDAANEVDKYEDGDEFLRVKTKGDDKDNDDEEEQERVRKIDEVFGETEKLDDDTMFLKDYFRNRMWVGRGGVNGGELDEDEEDEEEIERQEEYERDYNFRFEENAGNRVLGHSRIVEGSVRKKDNKRKEQKEKQKMRKEKVKFEMKEELKHLKNLKKKEILEKIQKIREVAGIGEDGVSLLDVSDLEEDFDPETYDKKMNKAFNDKYYDAEDPEFVNDSDKDEDDDIEKPDFGKEDDLLGLPKDWDEVYDPVSDLDPDSKDKFEGDEVNKSASGFMATRQKVLELKAEKGVDNDLTADKNVEAETAVKEVREKCMEEYYSLEYEDVVGDLKTRFKYRPVKPKRFGLSAQEILVADNKVLNQFVPIKKLAPYMETEWKVPRMKALQFKKQIREIPKRENSDVIIDGKNKFKGIGEKRKSNSEGGPQDKEVNGDDTSNISRRAKRRRVQSGLKLSHDRLLAYGKIPSIPKSKKK